MKVSLVAICLAYSSAIKIKSQFNDFPVEENSEVITDLSNM